MAEAKFFLKIERKRGKYFYVEKCEDGYYIGELTPMTLEECIEAIKQIKGYQIYILEKQL